LTERKYAKYILTEDRMQHNLHPEIKKKLEEQKRAGNYVDEELLFGIDDSVIKGAFYVGCAVHWEVIGEPVEREPGHRHDFDEVIGFVGTVKDRPRDLGGEIEYWIEDEKYIITKSSLIFIPKGVKHSPTIYRRIDHPIISFSTASSRGSYQSELIKQKKKKN
jgi:hypothetical protein